MRPRLVDWSLLGLVLFEAGSGLFSFLQGKPENSWLFVLHGVMGLAITLLLVWKLQRVWRRVVEWQRWDGATWAAVSALGFVLLVIAGGLWGFEELMEVARATTPHAFDTEILLAFRQAGQPGVPIGAPWLEGAMRDITSLGSVSVLVLVTAATIIYLLLIRRPATAVLIFVAVAGGQALSSLLKVGVDRPRPELVSHLVTETSLSFPSGHAMLSAVTYLTLGALAAQFAPGRTTRIYVLSLAVLVALLVGVSRIYLGVHWPSDVLAGWCAGSAWAMLCWLLARYWKHQETTAQPKAKTVDNDA